MAVLRERAIQLRRQGKTRRQIKEILGSMSNSTLDDALKGARTPATPRKPRRNTAAAPARRDPHRPGFSRVATIPDEERLAGRYRGDR
jgi:hypothetical protein